MEEARMIDALRILSRSVSQVEDRLRSIMRLSPAEYSGLLAFGMEKTIACHDFSLRMGLSPSRGSRIIERMVQRELIRRMECESDRRCKSLELTDKAIELKQRISLLWKDKEEILKKSFSPNDFQVMKKQLFLMANKLSAIDGL